MLRLLCITLLVVISLSSCEIFHHSIKRTYHKHATAAPYDAVIIPGLPYDHGKVNPMFKARLLWAVDLHRKGLARHIIFSGGAVHTPYVESVVMKNFAVKLGIPDSCITIEPHARHTHENISLGTKLADHKGFCKVAIATDPIQTWAIKNLWDRAHRQVSLLPFDMKDMPHYYKTELPVADVSEAFVSNFVPLKNR